MLVTDPAMNRRASLNGVACWCKRGRMRGGTSVDLATEQGYVCMNSQRVC